MNHLISESSWDSTPVSGMRLQSSTGNEGSLAADIGEGRKGSVHVIQKETLTSYHGEVW